MITGLGLYGLDQDVQPVAWELKNPVAHLAHKVVLLGYSAGITMTVLLAVQASDQFQVV